MAHKAERRQFGRRVETIQSWILIPGRPRISCRVRNYSPIGALLELEPPDWLPFRFALKIDGHAQSVPCEVRHRTPHGVGVRFAKEVQDIRWVAQPEFTLNDQWSGRQ